MSEKCIWVVADHVDSVVRRMTAEHVLLDCEARGTMAELAQSCRISEKILQGLSGDLSVLRMAADGDSI